MIHANCKQKKILKLFLGLHAYIPLRQTTQQNKAYLSYIIVIPKAEIKYLHMPPQTCTMVPKVRCHQTGSQPP